MLISNGCPVAFGVCRRTWWGHGTAVADHAQQAAYWSETVAPLLLACVGGGVVRPRHSRGGSCSISGVLISNGCTVAFGFWRWVWWGHGTAVADHAQQAAYWSATVAPLLLAFGGGRGEATAQPWRIMLNKRRIDQQRLYRCFWLLAVGAVRPRHSRGGSCSTSGVLISNGCTVAFSVYRRTRWGHGTAVGHLVRVGSRRWRNRPGASPH